MNYYSVLESASQKSGEEVEISDHAYIPYKYAHNCIAKIMEDMKNMKVTHVRIVTDIQHQYKVIEDETQVSIISPIIFCTVTNILVLLFSLLSQISLSYYFLYCHKS